MTRITQNDHLAGNSVDLCVTEAESGQWHDDDQVRLTDRGREMLAEAQEGCLSKRCRGRNGRLKAKLFAIDPHCFACRMRLSELGHQPNSACIVRRRLSCPAHVIHVRSFATAGRDGAAEKSARKWAARNPKLEQSRQPRERWIVDDVQFDDPVKAEQTATELARLLGCKFVIYLRLVDRSGTKVGEQVSMIVRPGADANCRDEKLLRERRKLVDFGHGH